MEELSREKRGLLPPQLLNLIPDEMGWKAREAGAGGSTSNGRATIDAEGEEDKLKLELKLGLPGVQQHGEDQTGPGESCSALSLARFTTHSWLTNAGAKRGFFHTKPQGYDRRQQQQDKREGCANELTLGGESMSGERKKGCCPPPPSSHGSAAAPPVSSSRGDAQGRAAAAPVVGWPPVRSFRRNLTNGSSSKQSPERQADQAAVDRAKKLICKKKPLIKINMDGIPIGRKVDLTSCDGYQKLSTAVQDLFRGFLEAQKDLACAEGGEEEIFSGLLDGTGEYVLLYEDNEGDRMLAGDIPWSAFVSTAKRLRVMRRSELPRDLIGANSGKAAGC